MSDDDEFIDHLEGEIFTYSLKNHPDEIFSDEHSLVFTLTNTCWCYQHFEPLKNKKIFIYVSAKDYYRGGRITYKQVFYEIDKQVKIRYDEIKKEYNIDHDYNLMCDHRFIEVFTKITQIQYDIWCGS